MGVQQPLPSPPNEKRGAEEYATTSMSIVMATMARSMPQFGLLMNTGRTSNAKCYQASLFRGGIDMIRHQMPALLAIVAAFFTIALLRFRKPSFKRRDGFL
ncbi:MAG TPA: hypothetical protein VFW91_15605 [Candidatus Binatia bacterium]|nr:hypothetical protein [Candidatus Binatia bacterium]